MQVLFHPPRFGPEPEERCLLVDCLLREVRGCVTLVPSKIGSNSGVADTHAVTGEAESRAVATSSGATSTHEPHSELSAEPPRHTARGNIPVSKSRKRVDGLAPALTRKKPPDLPISTSDQKANVPTSDIAPDTNSTDLVLDPDSARSSRKQLDAPWQGNTEYELRRRYEAQLKVQSCDSVNSERSDGEGSDSKSMQPSDPNKVDDVMRISAVAPNNPAIPFRQIRAVYDEHTIRVYQAYSDQIADSAMAQGTLIWSA